MPRWSPVAATMSKLSSTVVPSRLTSKTREPEVLVHPQRLAKYSRTCRGTPGVVGKAQFIAGLSLGDHRSESKSAFGVVDGTVPSVVAPGEAVEMFEPPLR